MKKSVHSPENAILLRLLVEHRKQAGWTQVQVADKLGLTQSAYSKLERGELRIDLIQLRTILGVMSLSLVDFVAELEQALENSSKTKKRKSSRRK